MRTLEQYTNETLHDIKKFITDEMGGNFDNALHLLKMSNSVKGLIAGVDSFINTNHVKISNDGYYLALLFSLSGLEPDKNKKVIQDIIYKNHELQKDKNVNQLQNMLKSIIEQYPGNKTETNESKNDETKTQSHIKNHFNKIEKDFLNKDNATGNIFDKFCIGFEELAQHIFTIDKFIKTGNTSNIGKGELLLTLLFGNRTGNGDVHINYKNKEINVEVKCGRAGLGESLKTNKDLTENFFKKLDFEQDNENSLFTRNGCTIINSLITKHKNNPETVLNIYIDTILERYNKNIKDLDDVLNIIKESYFGNCFLNGNIDKDNMKYFAGLLHLIGYQLQQQFNYLCVFNNTGNFYLLDLTNIANIFSEDIKNIIDFESSNNYKTKRDCVYKIKLKTKK
jgi:hypothetical protein